MNLEGYDRVTNAWEDMASSPEEAASLKARAQLMLVIREMIQERGLNQHDAAAILGVSQPRVSSLVRGKVREFSTDALIGYLAKLGWHMNIGYKNDHLNIHTEKHAA